MNKEQEYKELLLDDFKVMSKIILTYNKFSRRLPEEFSPLMNELKNKTDDKEYAEKTYKLYSELLEETRDILQLVMSEGGIVFPKHYDINLPEIDKFRSENKELFKEF